MESAAGVKKGAWTPEEDRKLVSYIMRYGIWNWRQMPIYAGLARTGKSCRLRWMNYLRPDVRRGPFDREEVAILLQLYQSLGNKWSTIAAQLPGRTDNDIKNFFHTHLKKRLKINNNNNNGSSPPLSRPKTSSIRTRRLISKTVATNNLLINNTVAAPPPESPDSWKYEVVVGSVSETSPPQGNNGNNEMMMMMSSTTSQVVILESNPNSLAPVSEGYTSSPSDVTVDMNFNFSSPPSDDFDVSSFWYNMLAEAQRI